MAEYQQYVDRVSEMAVHAPECCPSVTFGCPALSPVARLIEKSSRL